MALDSVRRLQRHLSAFSVTKSTPSIGVFRNQGGLVSLLVPLLHITEFVDEMIYRFLITSDIMHRRENDIRQLLHSPNSAELYSFFYFTFFRFLFRL